MSKLQQCWGKVRYRTWIAANDQMKHNIGARRRRRLRRERYNVYRCPYCQGFHIGGRLKTPRC